MLFSQEKYQKSYYKNDVLKAEGWIKDNKKTGYWKFYHRNGNLKKEGRFKDGLESKYWYFYSKNSVKEKEGHFSKGKQQKWWLFYDKLGNLNHKCQLKDNRKNGYCFIYVEKKLQKALQFKNGEKMKEWTDFSSFRKENNLNDLR